MPDEPIHRPRSWTASGASAPTWSPTSTACSSTNWGDLLGQLLEPTRVALMHELSQRGPAWARLPEDWPQLPRAAALARLAR